MAEGVEWAAKRRMRPLVSTSTLSARRSKITVEEPLDLDSENTETWQKLHGHAIVKGEDCRIWTTNRWLVAFVKVALWEIYEFGSTSVFQCQNESCPSHETNFAFLTTEKRRGFAINRASVLGFRAIDGGHATASKIFSFVGLYTWNDNFKLTNLW